MANDNRSHNELDTVIIHLTRLPMLHGVLEQVLTAHVGSVEGHMTLVPLLSFMQTTNQGDNCYLLLQLMEYRLLVSVPSSALPAGRHSWVCACCM